MKRWKQEKKRQARAAAQQRKEEEEVAVEAADNFFQFDLGDPMHVEMTRALMLDSVDRPYFPAESWVCGDRLDKALEVPVVQMPMHIIKDKESGSLMATLTIRGPPADPAHFERPQHIMYFKEEVPCTPIPAIGPSA